MGNKALKVRKKLESGKVKKKCCRDNPRCSSCSTVAHRLRKQQVLTLDDAALLKALKHARRW